MLAIRTLSYQHRSFLRSLPDTFSIRFPSIRTVDATAISSKLSTELAVRSFGSVIGTLRVKHILVATDFSVTAAAALREGAQLALLSGARLTLLHIIFAEKFTEALHGLDAIEYLPQAVNQIGYDSGGALARLDEKAHQKLDEAVSALSEPRPKIETAVTHGRPSSEVAAYASAHDVDLIVMGTHGRGTLGKAFLGSVADHLIRMAECPVMVVGK